MSADRRRSYEELAAEVVGLRSLVERLTVRLDAVVAANAELRAENASLKRQWDRDSSNSSTPPSQDLLAAKGKRRAQRS